jgi:hypothetical protein
MALAAPCFAFWEWDVEFIILFCVYEYTHN